MILKIKVPGARELSIEATKNKINGSNIWRIVFPKNETIFITRLNGRWKSVGKPIISYDLLDEMGLKLNLRTIINILNLSIG
jgi:hypothetical protein